MGVQTQLYGEGGNSARPGSLLGDPQVSKVLGHSQL